MCLWKSLRDVKRCILRHLLLDWLLSPSSAHYAMSLWRFGPFKDGMFNLHRTRISRKSKLITPKCTKEIKIMKITTELLSLSF